MDVLVAQRCAQLATQTAESAMSGVGRVAEETRHVRSVVEAAIAEAAAVSSRMEQKVASVIAQAEKTAVQAVSELAEHVRETVVETEAQTSRTVGSVVQ